MHKMDLEIRDWTGERFGGVARRSQVLHGNRHVLPVAVVIAERGLQVATSHEIDVALGGHLAPNRVLKGLEWLCAMGVMRELPYPGRPNPRMFERLDSSYWGFAEQFSGTRLVESQPRSRGQT
jgi:hypothetical protein